MALGLDLVAAEPGGAEWAAIVLHALDHANGLIGVSLVQDGLNGNDALPGKARHHADGRIHSPIMGVRRRKRRNDGWLKWNPGAIGLGIAEGWEKGDLDI